MRTNHKFKIPSDLAQYLRLKAKEHRMSECQLSKLIIPGSSGSLISSVRFNQGKLSEKKIKKIADYFGDDPNILSFMAGRMPKKIHDMIIKNKEIQFFLLDLLNGDKL